MTICDMNMKKRYRIVRYVATAFGIFHIIGVGFSFSWSVLDTMAKVDLMSNVTLFYLLVLLKSLGLLCVTFAEFSYIFKLVLYLGMGLLCLEMGCSITCRAITIQLQKFRQYWSGATQTFGQHQYGLPLVYVYYSCYLFIPS